MQGLTAGRAWCVAVAALLLLGAETVRAESAGPPAESGHGCPAPADGAEEAWPGQANWERLERAGYRMGEVDVQVRDVYVGERLAWYQRLANTLHVSTDPAVVRDLLTLGPGDAVTAQGVYESERLLRAQPFLTQARIRPAGCRDGRVRTAVDVRDAWTLQLGVGFGRAGGESTRGVGFTDENLLGTGKTVQVSWSDGRNRTTRQVAYRDPAVLGSGWTLGASHRQLSDGHGNTIELGYPFRRGDQAWGFRAEVEDLRTELEFEQAGETAYAAELASEQADVALLRRVARDPAGGWRAGVGWRHDHAAYGTLEAREPQLRPAPALADRALAGPMLVVERYSDRYRAFRNLQAIGKTEDFELGLDARLRLGRHLAAEGPREPWFADLELAHGVALGERDLVMTRLGLSLRYDEEGGRAAYYRSVGFDYYHRTGPRNTVVLHGEYDRRDRLDPEDELYLGGFDGLLAYPDRFRAGDRRWLLHLEDRYVSDVVLFDTVQLGYTAYVETGAIRGLDGRWSRRLANLGAGLRVGSLRSSFGTVGYLTVAVPLVDAGQDDDYSFVVGSTINF